jgi:hypothetical protein
LTDTAIEKMAQLFTIHSRGLAATYADIENQALAQGRAFLATPGSVLSRTNGGGFRYYALQQYDKSGSKRESYLAGPVGDPAADKIAEEARRAASEQRDVVTSIRLLMREGYAALEPKHYAAIAALANHGLFSEGAGVLVGTHGFEVIANRMGIRASAFATMGVDIGRAGKLAMRDVPEGGLLGILRDAGLEFERIPPLDHRERAVKIKEKGHSRFTVDLLVASRNDEYSTVYVPELDAYATALPYFRYLISETQPGAALSRLGCVAVRVPLAEKFAIHKLLVSQLRVGTGEKARKDLRQAAILIAALGEMFPGALEEAYSKTPVSARTRIRKSMVEAAKLLQDYPRARAQLDAIAAKR